MTYICENCFRYFIEPVLIEEQYGVPGLWGQQFKGCPYCRTIGMIEEINDEACRC